MKTSLLILVLVLGAAGGAGAQTTSSDPELERLRREEERLRREIERTRADAQSFSIGAYPVDGRWNQCEISMDLVSRVPEVRVVNRLYGTAEVTNGGVTSIQRFHFEEAEQGRMRHTKVTVDGRCERPTIRIMRIDTCELDRERYSDCGSFIRTTHPVSISPEAAR